MCVCVWASVVRAVLYVSPCQDVLSLGDNLSRCIIFRQGGSVCVSLDCVYICTVLCEPQLSR